MTPERITCRDVRVGDRIARTRTETFDQVLDIVDGEKSRYLTLDNGRGGTYRIRPRYEAKLWRAVRRAVPTIDAYRAEQDRGRDEDRS